MRCLITSRLLSFFLFFVFFASLLSACAGNTPRDASSKSTPLSSAVAVPKEEAVAKIKIPADTKKTDSACASSFFLKGRYHEILLQFDKALAAYEQAMLCDPQSDYISAKIPVLLLQLDQDNTALLWLESFLAKHPEHSGMRMLYANILLHQQKNTQAMEQYQFITDHHLDDSAVLLLLAEMYLGDNQLDRARQALQRVMQLDPESYLGHVLMGRLFASENNVSAADFHYRKALARNWSSDLHMEFAALYVASGQYNKAARLYQDLLRREDFNEEARLALVQVRFLQKKDNAAIAELKRLRNYVDEPQRVDLTIAQLYARQKRFDKAIALLREVLEEEALASARYLLAALLAQKQQYQEALEQIELIGPEIMEFPEAFTLRIRLLQELQRQDEAIALLENNLDMIGGQNADLYLLFAGLYQLRGEGDKALEILGKAIELQPENEQLLYEYALLLESRGRHTAAIKAMNRVLALNPKHAEALNFLGYVWADKGINLDQALIYIEQAVQLQPNSSHIRDSLGWIYYRLGRFREAIRELELAVRLGARESLVFEHLGDVCAADRQLKRAVGYYTQALERMPAEDEEGMKRVVKKKARAEEERP